MKGKYSTVLKVLLAFSFCTASLAEEDKVSLEERLASIESKISDLNTLVVERTPKAQPGDTYMPGWTMLRADKQKQLWYQRYLKPDGSSVVDNIINSDMVVCEHRDTTCVLSYQIPDALVVPNVNGYVLNIATHAYKHANFTSATCSDENGNFPSISHFSAYGFMNYRDVTATSMAGGSWKSGVLLCPVVKGEADNLVKIRFSTNPGEHGHVHGHIQSLKLEPGLITIGTLVGYW